VIVEEGTPEEVFSSGNVRTQSFLGKSFPFAANVFS
jgi:hypothetical protein